MLDLLLSPPLASQLDVIASPYAASAERRDALYELEVGLAHGLADTKNVHGARQRIGQGAEWGEVAPALISHLSRLHILMTHLSESCCSLSPAYKEEERENLAVEAGVCCSLLQGLALLVPGKRGARAEVEILLALASAPYWTTLSPSDHQGLTLAPAHLISTLNCLLLTHPRSHQPFELAGGPAVLQALADSTGDAENEEQEEATRGAALDWVELWAARSTAEQRAKLELDSAAPLRKVSATWERTKRRVSSGSTRSDCSAESCSSYGSLLSKGSTATMAETDIITPTDTPLLGGNPFDTQREVQVEEIRRQKLRAGGASSQRLRKERPDELAKRGDDGSLARPARRDVRIASGGSLVASRPARVKSSSPPAEASMEPPRTPRRAQHAAASELPAFCTPVRVRSTTSDAAIQARTATLEASTQAGLGLSTAPRRPSGEPTRGRTAMEPPPLASNLIAISPAVRRAQARSLSPRKAGSERYATTPGASGAQRPAGMPSRSRPVGSVLPGARSFSGADVFGRKARTVENKSPERRGTNEETDPSTTPKASRTRA